MTDFRPHERRTQACSACGRCMFVDSLIADAFEAPEMIRVPSDAWVGFIRGELSGAVMVVACSERCARALLELPVK